MWAGKFGFIRNKCHTAKEGDKPATPLKVIGEINMQQIMTGESSVPWTATAFGENHACQVKTGSIIKIRAFISTEAKHSGGRNSPRDQKRPIRPASGTGRKREAGQTGRSRDDQKGFSPSLEETKHAVGSLPLGGPGDSCTDQTLSFYRGREENGSICSIVSIWGFPSLKRTVLCFLFFFWE